MVNPSPAGHATWFSRAERVPELPKVVNTIPGAYASNLLFFVFPGHVDPNVPLTLGLMIERQMHIIKWLNKAEGACTGFVAGMYSSHCDCFLVGVEVLVIDWYRRVPRGGVGGLPIVACGTSRQIHLASLHPHRQFASLFDMILTLNQFQLDFGRSCSECEQFCSIVIPHRSCLTPHRRLKGGMIRPESIFTRLLPISPCT
jgi:hypothetical protein